MKRTSPHPIDAYPCPGIRDWALLAIGVGFTGAGLLILPFDRNVGIVTIAFFGLCAVVLATKIVRKLRFRRPRPLRAEIVGGVPIRPSRAIAFGLGASLFALGAILVTFGRGYGVTFWSISWLVMAVGSALSIGIAVGWLPVGFIRFDPPGITIARRRWSYTIPWDCISGIAPGELHHNPVLYVWLDNPHAVDAHPPECKEQVVKHLASNARWVGAHVMLMTSQYRLELPLLVQALERYLADPSARAELARGMVPGSDAI